MKNKEKLLKFYNEYGLTDTAKLLGFKRYDVLSLLGLPIEDGPTVNMLLEDLFRDGKLPKVDNCLDMYIDFNSVWNIETRHEIDENTHGVLLTLATPYWDGTTTIPVDSQYMTVINSEFDKLKDIELELYENMPGQPEEFENIESLLVWYRDVYLPFVNETINQQSKVFIEEYRSNF